MVVKGLVLCTNLIKHGIPHCFLLLAAFKYTISDGKGGTDEATVVVSVVEPAQPTPDTVKPTSQQTNFPTDRPTTRPSAQPTMRPSKQTVTTCDDMCFQPLDPDECPSCDPVILPSCTNRTLEFGAFCESDGECESVAHRG